MGTISNSLLNRQLRKLGISEDEPPADSAQWLDFLKRVEKAYTESDEDRYTLERSLELSSNDLTEMYSRSVDVSEQLKINTQKLNAVLSSMSEGVLLVNSSMRIDYANRAAEEILEIEVDSVKGKKFDLLFGAPGWIEECSEIINEKVEAKIETRLQTGRGKIVPLEIKFSPMRNKAGDYLGTVLAFYSMEKQKQKEGVLQQAKLNAENASFNKSNYLAEMSHEIRTPLNSIVSLTQLLSFSNLNEDQKEDVESIVCCVHSLTQIINDVLDVSKIEAGKLFLINNTFSLEKAINHIVKQFNGLLKQKKIEKGMRYTGQEEV
jgi:PAS domain S-box-containing protein